MSIPQRRSRFSLIELLLVIATIAVFAAVIMIGVDPNKELGEARDAQRLKDIQIILDAVYRYSVEHKGSLPDTITTIETDICRSGVNVDCSTEGLVNLNMLTGSYIVAIPADPKGATPTSTHYRIVKSEDRVTVSAPDSERATSRIEVTR